MMKISPPPSVGGYGNLLPALRDFAWRRVRFAFSALARK
jgi:hypothetical protein